MTKTYSVTILTKVRIKPNQVARCRFRVTSMGHYQGSVFNRQISCVNSINFESGFQFLVQTHMQCKIQLSIDNNYTYRETPPPNILDSIFISSITSFFFCPIHHHFSLTRTCKQREKEPRNTQITCTSRGLPLFFVLFVHRALGCSVIQSKRRKTRK